MKRYKLKVEPLTALHIGTGEEYNPLEYRIHDGYLERFSLPKLLEDLPPEKRPQLYAAIESLNPKPLLELLHNFLKPQHILYRLKASASVIQKYSANFGNTENQLLIGETYKSPTSYKPVLPGSSLKGAIRTAVVNLVAQSQKGLRIRNPRFAEQDILQHQSAQEDPFRALHISDCELEAEMAVSDFWNYAPRKDGGSPFNSIQMFKEYTRGKLMESSPVGYCELHIDDRLQAVSQKFFNWEPLKYKFDLVEVLNACTDFYRRNFEREFKKFYQHTPVPELQRNMERVLSEINRVEPTAGECVVRVGRFSQVENVTLENFRKPQARNNRWGTTRTITENYFPPGYVKITVEKPW
ncbi:MAG: type III-A CRISPR-associated RAMP protein Csm5 [Calditrichia bacterium]